MGTLGLETPGKGARSSVGQSTSFTPRGSPVRVGPRPLSLTLMFASRPINPRSRRMRDTRPTPGPALPAPPPNPDQR
jgi:hypothetical protein